MNCLKLNKCGKQGGVVSLDFANNLVVDKKDDVYFAKRHVIESLPPKYKVKSILQYIGTLKEMQDFINKSINENNSWSCRIGTIAEGKRCPVCGSKDILENE